MPLYDDFGKQKLNEKKFKYCVGDENDLDELELFRKLQLSLHFNAQNCNMDIDSINTSYFQFRFSIYFISMDTITRKQHHINRSVDDDPFALAGFVEAPPSVICIGGDN